MWKIRSFVTIIKKTFVRNPPLECLPWMHNVIYMLTCEIVVRLVSVHSWTFYSCEHGNSTHWRSREKPHRDTQHFIQKTLRFQLKLFGFVLHLIKSNDRCNEASTSTRWRVAFIMWTHASNMEVLEQFKTIQCHMDNTLIHEQVYQWRNRCGEASWASQTQAADTPKAIVVLSVDDNRAIFTCNPHQITTLVCPMHCWCA